jgi:hypothetical protein
MADSNPTVAVTLGNRCRSPWQVIEQGPFYAASSSWVDIYTYNVTTTESEGSLLLDGRITVSSPVSNKVSLRILRDGNQDSGAIVTRTVGSEPETLTLSISWLMTLSAGSHAVKLQFTGTSASNTVIYPDGERHAVLRGIWCSY